MIIAFDTYYYDKFSYTVAGVFEAWNSEKVKYFVCSRRQGIDSEYVPGELYKRELPPIMQCLEKIGQKKVDEITSIIVDGFVWLIDDKGEKIPGLGKRLQDAILEKYGHNLSIIGIAKNPYSKEIPGCKEVTRGKSLKPIYVTCTEEFYTEHYAEEVKIMFGENRIPDIIKSVDKKTRELCAEANSDTINEAIERNNRKNKGMTLGELAFDVESFDKWVAETKERGFHTIGSVNYDDAT